ncbi:hypothetical protein HDV57DRAFT_322428 [Trichoderma longibrachiatum]|uniref:Uncharacterized protein n=1 Tax=Trichoderma longibrachiatum ATCC 18648 TaxID=983965 RepID=A0A2T4BW60_TRILO|nr:hypothetical protein M440DRAFT_1064700 [Trichoderma longibrachiatum ATCC 18648]
MQTRRAKARRASSRLLPTSTSHRQQQHHHQRHQSVPAPSPARATDEQKRRTYKEAHNAPPPTNSHPGRNATTSRWSCLAPLPSAQWWRGRLQQRAGRGILARAVATLHLGSSSVCLSFFFLPFRLLFSVARERLFALYPY